MNQNSLALEILAIKLEKERANGRCPYQQKFQGQKYCTSRTLKCTYQQAEIIVIRVYKDAKNWSISPHNLCNYSPKNMQEAK